MFVHRVTGQKIRNTFRNRRIEYGDICRFYGYTNLNIVSEKFIWSHRDFLLKEYKNYIKLVKDFKTKPGYFRSIHTGRLVKDTPQNRMRETMEFVSPEDRKRQREQEWHKELKEIDNETDLRAKHDRVRALGIEKLSDWDSMGYHNKFHLLKNSKKKSTRKSEGYEDTGRIKINIEKKRVLKQRNKLEYVATSTDFMELGSDSDSDSESSLYREYEMDWDNIIESSKIPLREYQKKAVKFLEENKGIVVGFDVGCGKTLTAVTASICALKSMKVEKVYVVSPKSLHDNFSKELKAFLGDDASRFDFGDCYHYYTHTNFVNTFKNDPYKCDKSMIIIDEAHEFRTSITENGDGKSAYVMINCCIRAKKVMCLTATPLINDFSDITNIVSLTKGESPLLIPPTIEGKMYYCKNLFTFQSLEVGDLPTKRYHEHEFEMSLDFYSRYLDIQRGKTSENKDPFVFLTGLRHAMNAITPNPKIEWALNRVESLKLKTILYSAFIHDGIKLITDGLIERDIPFVVISGEMTKEERSESVRLYNTNVVNVMIISKAGSLGLDLKETREVIFIESSWNPSQEEQVEGRACRIGSHSHLPEEERFVDIHRLYLLKPSMENLAPGDRIPSADSLLRSIVERKKKELDMYYLMLRALDIDPVKAKENFEKFSEQYLKKKEEEAPKASTSTTTRCPYEILGVSKNSSNGDCTKAFRLLSLKLHPDRNYNETDEVRKNNEILYKRAASALDYITGKDSRPMF